MPKSREEKGVAKHSKTNCDFCGHHKDDVPLLVVSNNSKVAICSWCALGVIEQTFKHGLNMEKTIRDSIANAKQHKKVAVTDAANDGHEPQPQPTPPKIEIVPAGTKPDKVDAAIGRALSRGKR